MRKWKQTIAWTGGAILIAAILLTWRSATNEPRAYPVVSDRDLFATLQSPEEGEASYIQWIRGEKAASLKAAKGEGMTLLAADYAAAAPEAKITRRYDAERAADVVDWNNDEGWLEWQVEVPEDGLYEVTVRYAPLDGSFGPIVRGIQIDGEFPYREAERLELDRLWKDRQYPYERNSIRNEVRPVQLEVKGWIEKTLADHSVSPEPLKIALAKGKHTLRLTGVSEPVSLHSISIEPPAPIPSYAEYASAHEAGQSAGNGSWFDIVEGENFKQKTASGIRTLSISDAFISPDPKGRIAYNAIGGTTWQNPGESVSWDLTVPETGWYALDVKYFQGYNGNATAYRTIEIDGKVPFREMLRYRFAPHSSIRLETLSDSDGNPYRFYLTEGTHSLRLTADNSLIRPAILALYQINERLTDIEQSVRVISGNYGFGGVANLDLTRVWEMDRYDPQIEEKLRSLRDGLRFISDYLKGLYQGTTEATTALDEAIDRLDRMLDDVNNLPNEVTAFTDIKFGINNWTQSIENQPMYVDQWIVRAPEADPDIKEPGTGTKIKYAAAEFFRTFFQSYDTEAESGDGELTIWVQRGRDYVDLLQSMIEEEFTPRTGIKVNLSLTTNQNALLMSSAAGDQPDLALGFGMEVPADFAMRGAAADLSTFEGFEEVEKRFNPGVMRSYEYDGKVFGLPETVTYNMMFVRNDILEDLGIKPPDTWEDVRNILPTLQENAMTFMYPKVSNILTAQTTFMPLRPDFITPFYQHGAEFYTSDGLKPKLADDKSYAAFQEWVDWYGKYDLPRDVQEFFNYMRFGAIPVGIGDISTYIQLKTAAPELAGNWSMLPIPGVKQPDGTVARWTSQGTTSAMILEASDKKAEAWKFLEWWTSDDVQSRYGRDIESLAGIAYRWNTSNVNALQTLPWEEEDLQAINEQWRWAKNMPFVPGYYMLPREMEFAWNDVLLNGTPPREALDEAQMSLMREMLRKQTELDLKPGDDLHIKPYDRPSGKE